MSPNFKIEHISVKYLNIGMCGNDNTLLGLVEHEKAWASFSKINKNDDTLSY